MLSSNSFKNQIKRVTDTKKARTCEIVDTTVYKNSHKFFGEPVSYSKGKAIFGKSPNFTLIDKLVTFRAKL